MNDLEQLFELQRVDTAADQARHRRAHLPARARLAEVAARLAELRAAASRGSARLEQLASEGQAREAELSGIRARRRELERRLASSSVPREVQGFTDELSVLTERQRGIEDLELEAMEEGEGLETAAASRDGELATLEAEAGELADELTVAETEIDAELDTLVAARPAIAASIPEPLLARYGQMRARLGGVAVARLEKNHCTGCHLALSASEVDRLRLEPPDALVQCEQCGRLLVR